MSECYPENPKLPSSGKENIDLNQKKSNLNFKNLIF